MSTLFGYRPLNTFMHRLDPRLKLMWFLVFSLTAVSWNDPIYHSALLVLILVFARIARTPILRMAKILLFLIPAFLALYAINACCFEISARASIPSGYKLYYLGYVIPRIGSFGPYWHLSLEALVFATSSMLRIIIVVFMGRLLLSFTAPSDLSNAMTKLHAPLEMSTAVSVAFGFLPVTMQQVTSIFEAQKSRGWQVSSRNPVKAVRGFVPTVIPIIRRSISRSEFLAAAIASRGYGYNPGKRTYLKEVKFRRTDWIVLVIFVAWFIFGQTISLGLQYTNYFVTVRFLRNLLGIPP